jgi:hemerythrin-like domain-containing protein
MRPTEILSSEHRVIEQVLDCLERIADNCSAQGSLNRESAEAAIDFFRTFADRCHHGKEETYLFPAMEACGFPSWRSNRRDAV